VKIENEDTALDKNGVKFVSLLLMSISTVSRQCTALNYSTVEYCSCTVLQKNASCTYSEYTRVERIRINRVTGTCTCRSDETVGLTVTDSGPSFARNSYPSTSTVRIPFSSTCKNRSVNKYSTS
jgi:hypothetical protein